MKKTSMQFKNFAFPVNPEKIEIKAIADLKEIPVPFSVYTLQEFGMKPLKITGSGFFLGKDAQQDFGTLFDLFLQGGEGTLFLSGAEPLQAIMTKLSQTFEDAQDCVGYTFEFIEIPQPKATFVYPRYHWVREGETLWSIACQYDVIVEQLFAINPSIPNAWAIRPGDQVKIS